MLPERDFDPVLKRVLQTSSGVAASVCPDAETLAAWHERTLPATEVVAFERHAADCARCRAMLAAFVRADLAAPAVETRAGVVDAVPFWRRWRLNWLVPMAATATALALYVAAPAPSDDRVVTVESLASAVSDAARSNEVPAPLEKRREAEADAPVSSVPPERLGPEARTSETGAAAAPSLPVTATADERTDARDRRAQADADTARDLTAPAARQALREPSGPPSSSSSSSTGFAPVPAAPEAMAPAAQGAVAAPPPPARVGSAETLPSAAPAAGGARFADAPPVDRAPSTLRRERLADLKEQAIGANPEQAARVVPLSGSSTSLRFRIDGERLERSASADTWSVVPLPAGVLATEITSGVSAGQAIWMVGRGGLVLRAPDGVRFGRVSSPASVDLLSVTAEDARSATVVASDGRRYSTTDGGASWTER